MAENEIRFLGDLQRLDLKPGDRFVLVVEQPLTTRAHECIQDAWRNFVGGDAEHLTLLILDQGMKLGVISAAAPAEQPETVQ